MSKRKDKYDDAGARTGLVARGGLWVLAQLPVMALAAIIPVRYGAGSFIPAHPLSIAGAAITVLGVILALWGLAGLGDALTPFPKPLSRATLQQRGAYRLMRHPIYTGVMLACLGWALWWLSGFGLLYGLAVAVFFDRKAAYEEGWLLRKYRNYPDYARRVKKFIPGLY